MPDLADEEYKLLAKRCITNVIPLLVGTPVQGLYVDGFRPGNAKTSTSDQKNPEWEHWQRSRLDARQAAVYSGAVSYGHSFAVTELTAPGSKEAVTKGLSALRTAALFDDPANDDTPITAITVTQLPGPERPGKAILWDERGKYQVSFKSWTDTEIEKLAVSDGVRHGSIECPVTRFAATIDLDGRTMGIVEPVIALQDRINQTVFDLLVAQTYGSFKVRWATGMAPPVLMEPVYELDVDGNFVLDASGEKIIEDYKPRLDSNGLPIPAPVNLNARRFMFGEDPTVKFGAIDGTPLEGYIRSVEMSIRQFSAISQIPPHHLLGEIINLSAEALMAAETSLQRMISLFQTMFGESWERVFRLANQLEGRPSDEMKGEVRWREMESRSLAQAGDGLGKMAEKLGAPKKGLWRRIPGMTETEYNEWVALAEEEKEEDSQTQLANAINRATVDQPPLPESQATFGGSPVAVTG